MEKVFFDSWREFSRLASNSKFGPQSSARSRVLDDRLKCIGKRSLLERLRSKCVHRSTRFTQAAASEFTRSADVTNSVLLVVIQQGVFSSFHLHDHAGEPLSERVVNVLRHAGSLFENGSHTLLLDELLPMRRHHHVVSEGLSKFDLVCAVHTLLTMLNAYEA